MLCKFRLLTEFGFDRSDCNWVFVFIVCGNLGDKRPGIGNSEMLDCNGSRIGSVE